MAKQSFQRRFTSIIGSYVFCSKTSILLILLQFIIMPAAYSTDMPRGDYLINAGDQLSITVWNEPSFSAAQLLVRPDGFISAPVVGEIKAGGKTIDQLQVGLAEHLTRYLKDKPTVVATILIASGSQIFVLGKVNAPGAYPMRQDLDVTQAIAMARGLNAYAAENKIQILRRDVAGVQRAIEFKYGKVSSGKDLTSNILLSSGDVVIVP